MRRTNLLKTTSALLTAAMVLSVCGCSAKPSTDTVETSAEAVTETETESEEEETVSPSANDPSGNDVSDNDVSEPESEAETEESELSSVEETEEETGKEDETEEEETTTKKTSAKETTKATEKETTAAQTTTAVETTTVAETTTEAVTVQSVSAVVNGTHYVGETLSGSDFTVTVTMSDGSTLTNPAGWSANPLSLTSTSNLITVAYSGASVTITVNAETVPETTTAAVVAQATTAMTVAQTTAATTAAATTQEATTVAVTTASNEESITIKSGNWSYEFALLLFDAQNELRIEAGLEPFIWDDQCYEVAKQCSKICGDAGTLDHDLTKQYRSNVSRTTSDGRTIQVFYDENLQGAGCYEDSKAVSVYKSFATNLLNQIKGSPGHYADVINEAYEYAAVAVYRHNDGSNNLTISYIFYSSDYGFDVSLW